MTVVESFNFGSSGAPPFARATPPFAALRAFDAFARAGSLRRAAKDLGIDHAAVSRHLRALETWVGVLLIDRRHSGGRLTEQGERYHRRVSAALNEIHAATTEIMEPDGGAPLKICCSSGFAAHWLAPRLGRFREENRGFDVEVQPTELAANLASGEADADIRYLTGRRTPDWKEPALRSVELSRPVIVPIASPDFLAACGPIREAADLLGLPLLHKKGDDQWRFWLEAQGLPRVRRLPGLRLWNTTLTLEAARSGQGIALCNVSLLGDDFSAGRLMQVIAGTPVATGAYFFTARTDRWQTPNVQRLRRWLQDNLAD